MWIQAHVKGTMMILLICDNDKPSLATVSQSCNRDTKIRGSFWARRLCDFSKPPRSQRPSQRTRLQITGKRRTFCFPMIFLGWSHLSRSTHELTDACRSTHLLYLFCIHPWIGKPPRIGFPNLQVSLSTEVQDKVVRKSLLVIITYYQTLSSFVTSLLIPIGW